MHQIFDFIYAMVTAFIFDGVTVQTSNRLVYDFFPGLSVESPLFKKSKKAFRSFIVAVVVVVVVYIRRGGMYKTTVKVFQHDILCRLSG